jgi:hypothetical protein
MERRETKKALAMNGITPVNKAIEILKIIKRYLTLLAR